MRYSPSPQSAAAGLSDGELVGQAQDGDVAAVCRLLGRYREAVRGVCHRWLDSDTAEDAVQETAVRFLEHLAELDGGRAVGRWVLRVAKNVCIDRLRRRGRVLEVPLTAAVRRTVEDSQAAERLAQVDAGDGVVGEVLDELSDRDAAILVARHGEGEAVSSIADRWGLTRGSMGVALQRARERARRIAGRLTTTSDTATAA